MSRTFGAPVRFSITLNVDFGTLDTQIGCLPIQTTISKNPVKVEDIQSNVITFLDPNTKKSIRWIMTMRDISTKIELPLKLETPKKCWCCHQPFTDSPLGCPIKLVHVYKTETYYSHQLKKEIVIKTQTNKFYYLTKGLLCDWECLLGFAESKRGEVTYRESIQLSHKMRKECGGTGTITPFPGFTILEDYGGVVPVSKCKEKLDTYSNCNNDYVKMVTVGELFNVSSKF